MTHHLYSLFITLLLAGVASWCTTFLPKAPPRPPLIHALRSTLGMTASTRLLTDVLTKTVGDYVHLDLALSSPQGQQPLNPYFNAGEVRFLINGGGLHPAVHSLAAELTKPGQTLTRTLSGGPYEPSATAEIPADQAPAGLAVGDVVKLSNGAQVCPYLKPCYF